MNGREGGVLLHMSLVMYGKWINLTWPYKGQFLTIKNIGRERKRKVHLMVSNGARTALVIAPANAPLINSPTSLVLKKFCTIRKRNLRMKMHFVTRIWTSSVIEKKLIRQVNVTSATKFLKHQHYDMFILSHRNEVHY